MDIQIINKLDQDNIMSLPFIGKSSGGTLIEELSDRTSKECTDSCLLNEKCLYSNYYRGSNKCGLFGAQVRDGFTMNVKTSNSYDTYNNSYYQGFDIGSPLQMDEESCRILCSNDDNCSNYNYGNNTCYLMGMANDPLSTTSVKMIKRNAVIEDETLKNNMYCCMNYPLNIDCGEYLPFSPKCDVFMEELCATHPDLEQCGCINRKSNFRYNGAKNKMKQIFGKDLQDECWYPACRPGSKSYIPTEMLPIGVDLYAGGEMNRIDNLKCAGSRVCDISNLNDPNFIENCRGLTGLPLISDTVNETESVQENAIISVPQDAFSSGVVQESVDVTASETVNTIEPFDNFNINRYGDQFLTLIVLIIVIFIIMKFSSL